MKLNLYIITILAMGLTSCASNSFKKKIESAENDAINDESFMRYNSNRIDTFEKKSTNDISKAQAACHEEKFTKGFDLLEDQMQQQKTNPFYWNALGTCYYLKDQTAKAQFYFDLASESLKAYKNSDKNLAEANIENNLGLIHLKYKRFNEAFDSFKKSSSLAPNYLTPKVNMAQVYLEFNQNERALDILKSIEPKAHGDIDILYSMALAYFRMGNYDQSFNTMIKINRNYLNRPDIVGLYALNLIKKNRYIDAKTILEKRIVAEEFENRNKQILENVNNIIKDQDKKKSN